MKKIVNLKISRLFLAFFTLCLFASCDQSSSIEDEKSPKQEQENASSSRAVFSSSQSEDSIVMHVDVQQEEKNSFNLLSSADSFLVLIDCDSGNQFVGQKSNTFTLEVGDSCRSELQAFEIGKTLYEPMDSQKNFYQNEKGDKLLITPSRGSNELGGWDANFDSQKVLITHETHGQQEAYSFRYNYQAVSIDDDDPNVLTESSFLKSKEQDSNITIAGHKAPEFSLVGQKDLNDGNSIETGLNKLQILLEGKIYAANVSFALCKNKLSSSCGSTITPDDSDVTASDLFHKKNRRA